MRLSPVKPNSTPSAMPASLAWPSLRQHRNRATGIAWVGAAPCLWSAVGLDASVNRQYVWSKFWG
jgi:hypothetical protein